METIRKVRIAISKGMGIRAAARKFNLSRETIRKIIRTGQTEFTYKRNVQPHPALGPWLENLEKMLSEDALKEKSKRRSFLSFYAELQGLGYGGSYSSVKRYCSKWREKNGSQVPVFIPQRFEKGEAFQFDWSSEKVEIAGVMQTIGVAHIRLCHSRMSFIACYPLQRLEMVMDAHIKAHNFFGGLCRRGIYDNLKSVVTRIGKGKEREFNPRMIALSSHYLFELDACTPAAGWEKGQVERQVKTMREKIFENKLSFSDFSSLQEYIEGRLMGLSKSMEHPEFSGRSIYEVFEEERDYLVKSKSEFAGHITHQTMVSSTSLITYDTNKYSVPCKYVKKPVEIRAYAWCVKICHEGNVICEHPRDFGKKHTITDWKHYLSALDRKPGALRNGIPFQDAQLPKAIGNVKDYLLGKIGGDRQIVEILNAIPIYGIEAVEVACALALEQNAVCKSAILNFLARVSEDLPPENICYDSIFELKNPPLANCLKYQVLLGVNHGA